MDRRVVITGLGTINPIGHNTEETWKAIENKVCGIDFIKAFDTTTFKTKVAAEIKDYDPLKYFDVKAAKRNDKFAQYAIIAAREAVAQSGITAENTDLENAGTFIASGIGGMMTFRDQAFIMKEKGNNRVSPLTIPMDIVNIAAGSVAIETGFKGESTSHSTACASSTQSVGEAYRTIKHGYEDVILAGGTEGAVCDLGIAGFENMKALSTSEDPLRASTPFDKERGGFVMGEGAAMLVLEELEHAKKRGAKILAEVVGYGSTTDAYHITSPCPDGSEGARAMTRAIEDAGIKPEDVDYINAHGTSTHLNDSTETMAIKKAFGEYAKKVMVSSTKGNTGHMLGGAGAIEALICVKALQNGLVPPTLGYKVPDEECDLDVVPNEPRKYDLKYVMSNSLGFGGHNASIILKKYEE